MSTTVQLITHVDRVWVRTAQPISHLFLFSLLCLVYSLLLSFFLCIRIYDLDELFDANIVT